MTEHGVRLFGSSPRESWGRLRQVTGAGTTRDLWHLSRAEVVLGREEGDIIFPDDEFMSRRHATLSRGARAVLGGLGITNVRYRVADGSLADVVWGNHDAIDRALGVLGETRTLSEWFQCLEAGS